MSLPSAAFVESLVLQRGKVHDQDAAVQHDISHVDVANLDVEDVAEAHASWVKARLKYKMAKQCCRLGSSSFCRLKGGARHSRRSRPDRPAADRASVPGCPGSGCS